MIRLKRNICLGIVALLIVFLVTLKIQDTLYQKTLPEQQPEIESIKKEIGKIEITTILIVLSAQAFLMSLQMWKTLK